MAKSGGAFVRGGGIFFGTAQPADGPNPSGGERVAQFAIAAMFGSRLRSRASGRIFRVFKPFRWLPVHPLRSTLGHRWMHFHEYPQIGFVYLLGAVDFWLPSTDPFHSGRVKQGGGKG
jgi:hypothetical protein